MHDISRDELDSKLELIETRMDGRISAVTERIDGFLAAQAEHDKAIHLEIQVVKDLALEARNESREARSEMRNEIRGFKWLFVSTTVLAVIAILAGVASFNAALVSNFLSAFDAGRQISEGHALAAEQLRLARALTQQAKSKYGEQHPAPTFQADAPSSPENPRVGSLL